MRRGHCDVCKYIGVKIKNTPCRECYESRERKRFEASLTNFVRLFYTSNLLIYKGDRDHNEI